MFSFALPVRWRWALVLGVGGPLMAFAQAVVDTDSADEAARVIILANARDADSVDLAHYYASRRGVPTENILELPLPAGETVTWREFIDQIHGPLQAWLIEHGWIDAIAMDLLDEVGRRKIAASGHRISYLVTCRGVPLKISQFAESPLPVPDNLPVQFRTNQAAVDSELTQLARGPYPIAAFVMNALFQKTTPTALEQGTVVRVARLDGPTYQAARGLVDAALAAERNGLIGRAVVDVGGPHRRGDEWMEATVQELAELGWPPDVDRERATLGPTARADEVAFYMGWYANDLNGPFALPGYEFAPGAVAMHIHSYSARTLRLANGGGWCGPLVARGGAATFGNVFEPYLEYCHEPHLITRALGRGATLGEAAYYAMPVLSWQGVVIGDPLYRPFARAFAEQWERRRELPARQAGYIVARELARRDLANESPEVLLELAREEAAAIPSLVLTYEVARRLEATGDRSAAVQELGAFAHMARLRPDEWGLAGNAARLLQAWGRPHESLAVWRQLLGQTLSDEVRLAWLREARPVAAEAGDQDIGLAWDRELARLAGADVDRP